MRISRLALMGALGVIMSGTGAVPVSAVPRSHSKFSIPEFHPTKIDKKPNKLSQKKRRIRKRQLGNH